MPPRKSTARQPSATPVKKTTRSANTLPDSASASKRSLRSASQAPDQTNGAYPNLPEIQTQQSYAYGSTKTPLLPEQLRASEKMSLNQMASTIDQQRSEADQRFRDHVAEVETNLAGQPEARTTRVTRRRASASVSPPREGSHDSVNSEVRKTQRTAAWASSLDSEQLEHITEEESDLNDDDNTRHGTDPSSFPSGIFDHSYNYERGLRRPRMLEQSANAVGSFLSDLRGVASQVAKDVARISRVAASTVYEASYRAAKATVRALPYVALTMLGVCIAALAAMSMSFLFCFFYRRTLCNPSSTSAIQTTLQSYCGECLTSSYTLPENMTPEQQADVTFISKAINDLRRQLHDIEKRIDSKLDAKYSLFSTSLDDLKDRHHAIETHLNKLQRHSPSSQISLTNEINYFAPATGAIINPYSSSPTLQRPPHFLLRLYQRLTGRVTYISPPPAAALEPWHDLGDCWCSPGSTDIRLTVKLGYSIYPTHLVIEHIPALATPDPGTAPRDVEVWTSFLHLTPEAYAELGIWELVGSDPIAPGWGRIGTAKYDARPGAEHAQTFTLEVNRGVMRHATDEVTVRVLANQGAERTCLYRVKLYGEPVVPHPTAVEG